MTHCCHCGCEKINFKVFDFDDGTLLWELLLRDPVMATDGDIYSTVLGTPFSGYEVSQFLTVSSTTLSLPARDASIVLVDAVETSIDRRNGTTGSLTGNSGWYETLEDNFAALSSAVANVNASLVASRYHIDDGGEKVLGQGFNPKIVIWITDPTTSETEITYYINAMPVNAGSVSLRMDSLGTMSPTPTDADFEYDDDAATVETAINTAFGANVTDVTVSGDTIATSGFKIVIDWADADHYLDELDVDFPSAPTNARIGTRYLRNQRTGLISTGRNVGLNAGDHAWQDNGDLFMCYESGSPQGFASYDVSTTTWTEQWTKNPLSGKSPIVPDRSNLNNIKVMAAGGLCGIAFPFTASFVLPLNQRMSVITWDNNGNNREHYDGGGNNFTGYQPLGLCVEDGGTDLACQQVQWRDQNVQPIHGDSNTEEIYGSGNGECVVRFTSGSGYSLQEEFCLGDFAGATGPSTLDVLPGFDDTHVAFNNGGLTDASLEARMQTDSDQAGSDSLIARYVAEELSGIGIPEVTRWRLHYDLFTWPNSLGDSGTEWRLRWTRGGLEEYTAWLSDSTTLAQLQTELDSVFGTDVNGDSNVEADDSGKTPSPVSVPLYRQGLNLECLGAKSSADETTMGTHEMFTIGTGTVDNARNNMPKLWFEVNDFDPAVTKTFGKRKWSDGVVTWQRNFNATGSIRKVVSGCQLHDGRLYVLSIKQCGEGVYGGSSGS